MNDSQQPTKKTGAHIACMQNPLEVNRSEMRVSERCPVTDQGQTQTNIGIRSDLTEIF
jgi:hypothetical protein